MSNSDINYLLKQAGLPPLAEVTSADITRALSEVATLAAANKLDEGVFSTLKAILATVGQQGSKAGKAAADKASKLPSTLKAMYKETEVKDQLRILYRQFTVMLTTMDKIVGTTKTIQEKDPEVKKELDLFTSLLRRTIDTLQARAGLSVAVKEVFDEDDLPVLLEKFLAESGHAKKYHVKYHVEPDKTMHHGIFHGHTLQNVVGMMAYGGYTVHSIEHADDHDGDDHDTPAPAPAAAPAGGDMGGAVAAGGDAGGGDAGGGGVA